MYFVFIVLIFSGFGALKARQPDIDINRVKLIPKEPQHRRLFSFHSRRSIINHNRRDDNDYHSSRYTELRPPMHVLYNTTANTEEKIGKVYQPREDPRIFYQSNAYIEETNRKNLNNEVSSVYLGRGVVRASENNILSPLRSKYIESNEIDAGRCVRCPHDRTLIANVGVDRVVLQYPEIFTCSGKKAPRFVKFTRMYGPKFGSLLKQGSHMLVGRVTYKNEILQTCKMQIHVLLQSCPVPKYLVTHCEAKNKTCRFKCRNSKAVMSGQNTLTCEDDLQWSGQLPTCSVQYWCAPPPPPPHGKVSCKGVTTSDSRGLTEGSSCRVRCAMGWRRVSRSFALCRFGHWTNELSCQPRHTKY